MGAVGAWHEDDTGHPASDGSVQAGGQRVALRASVWRSSARRRPNRRGCSLGTWL